MVSDYRAPFYMACTICAKTINFTQGLKKNPPIFKQCLKRCRMLNEKINYKIIRVDFHLKNVSILCEVDRVRTRLRYKKALGIHRRYDHLTSLLQLKVITEILPCIILFITRRLFSLNYGGTPFV
jgi:hypothetical protein